MKLSNQLIDEIVKALKTGMYVKDAVQTVGVSKKTFYLWKEQGEKIDARCVSDEGELIQKEYKILSKSDKLKLHFLHSIRLAESQAKQVLVAAVFSHIKDDWKAAMEILARRFPEDWAKKEFMDFKGNMEYDRGAQKLKEFEEEFKDVPRSAMSEIAEDLVKKLRNEKEKHGKEKNK